MFPSNYMKKDIDLTEYGRNIIRYKNIPHKLDELQLELVGFFAYYNEQMIQLELEEAGFWEIHKDINSEKPKSDPFVRALWKITLSGKRMTEVSRTISTISKLISSIQSSLKRQSNELRSIK